MPRADAFFSPKWLWKTWRSYDRPHISLHTCFILQKATSLLRCQLQRKLCFCFQLDKQDPVKPSQQPPVALVQSSCWRCFQGSPTCIFFRWTGDGASNLWIAGFSYLGHMIPSWCTECHMQTEDVAVLCWLVCFWAGKAFLVSVIQGWCLSMHYKGERAISTGISVSELLWTDSRLELRKRRGLENTPSSWVPCRYYLSLQISP